MNKKFLFLVVFLCLLSFVVVRISTTTEFDRCPPNRSFEDAVGSKVCIEGIPERVVSTMPSITELLFALGLDHKVVGIDAYSDYPPHVRNFVSSGNIEIVGTPATIDVEKVVLLKPDIVFVCSGTNGVDVILMKKLRLYGLRTFALRCDSAKELKNIVEDIEAVGKMFNVEDKALQIIERLGEELSWVENKLKDSYRPKVLKLIGPPSWGLYSVGGDTYSSWMITKAGAINVASEYSGYPKLSYEFIISSDPDIIIITVMSADIGRLKKELSNSPIVNTKAWRTGRVFVFLGDADNLISRPGPRVAMGVKLLARVIHPDIFGGDLPQNVVRLGD